MSEEFPAGRLPTASGFGRIRAVDPTAAAEGLREVVAAAAGRHTVMHCCAPDVPFVLLRDTGIGAVSVDLAQLSPKGWESLAATIESGVDLWAGVIATDGAQPRAEAKTEARSERRSGARAEASGARAEAKVTEVIGPLVEAWRRVGLPVQDLARVTLTPACGLAGVTPEKARSVQGLLVDAARALTETAGS